MNRFPTDEDTGLEIARCSGHRWERGGHGAGGRGQGRIQGQRIQGQRIWALVPQPSRLGFAR